MILTTVFGMSPLVACIVAAALLVFVICALGVMACGPDDDEQEPE